MVSRLAKSRPASMALITGVFLAMAVVSASFVNSDSVYADHQYCRDGTAVPHGNYPGYSSDFCSSRGGVDVPIRSVGDLGGASDLGIPTVNANQSTLNNILNAAFILIGSLSVIFAIVGGLRYVLAAGNPENAQKAKNTILYAVVGLVVSLFAYAIVNFVMTNVI